MIVLSVRRDKPAESVKLKYFSIEVLAPHNCPESCARFRKVCSEALTGERIGRALLPVIESQVPTLEREGEGNSVPKRHGKLWPHLAGTKNWCMSANFLRENREALPFFGAAPSKRIVNLKGVRR